MKGFINDLFCPLCVEILESHQTFFEWGILLVIHRHLIKVKEFLTEMHKVFVEYIFVLVHFFKLQRKNLTGIYP